MTAFGYAKNYKILHETYPKWFSGQMGIETAMTIRGLVEQVGAKRLLDYGSGKGYQYLTQRMHEVWGILPECYDVGVQQLSARPEGLFDGIICTDVMEHIAERDLAEILTDIVSLTRPRAFIYFAICCRLAWKTFPDGTNVHLTVRPPDWWRRLLLNYQRDGLTIYDDYEYFSDRPGDDVQCGGLQGIRS